MIVVKLKMPKASTFSGKEHIPLPHPPPMASQAGHAQLHRRLLLLFSLTEHPLDKILATPLVVLGIIVCSMKSTLVHPHQSLSH